MINIWMIVVMVVFPVILTAANIYFIAYFQHPEEKGSSWLAKILVVFSLLVAEVTVFLLPLDIANRGPPPGGIPMGTIWLVFYVLITVLVILVIPFFMFWYDAEDAEKPRISKRIAKAAVSEVIVLVVFAIVYVVLYIFFGISTVNTQKLNAPVTALDAPMPNVGCLEPCMSYYLSLSIRISPLLFLASVLDLVGYFFLVLFGGIGMTALPFDLILGFKHRPQPIPKEDYLKGKADIGRRADQLLEIGNLIVTNRKRGARGRKERDRYNRWRQAVELLDTDLSNLRASYEISGVRIILDWCRIPAAFMCIVLSVFWVLHIILYLIVPNRKVIFLNGFFIALDKAWTLLGVIAYAIFAFYLLLCVLKGIIKFGMRFFFLVPIYPMKVGATFLSAFLFNTLVILISALSVTHFCTDAFSDYARITEASQIFGLSINSLRILMYWFKYSVWGLLLVPLLAWIFLGIKPHDPDASAKLN